MRGKSVCVVNDLTVKEQLHLYEVARQVKEQVSAGLFPQHNDRKCAYLMFLEDSTRTKESFRNAAATLDFRTNMFDSTSSSLNKSETLNDTVRMLCGYTAMQSVFIIRSKIEGLCKSLSDSITEYANRSGIPVPSFVNAGDGKHEHPTQEFLDEFSFLEQLGGKTDKIHIALVGDLLLGRTIHSKADGLRIFSNVVVDLVAPKELQLPGDYVKRMEANGFVLNVFGSLDEYIESASDIAPILYFTRLQLERMDKTVLEKEHVFRAATTLRMEMLRKLPEGAKIYHPLPRHGEFPEIPFEVDKTVFNGYDEQSRNGYFVRTALLGLLTGIYVDVFTSPNPVATEMHILPTIEHAKPLKTVSPFFTAAAAASPEPIAWIEVDFPEGTCPSSVRKAISRMRVLSNIETRDGYCQISGTRGSHTVYFENINNTQWLVYVLTAFAGCNPRIIFERSKGQFFEMTGTPPRTVSRLPGMGCLNSACVSRPDARQRDVPAVFEASRLSAHKFTCRYCEREVSGIELFAAK